MRRDDRVRLRHMRDAAREAVGFAARKRRTELDDDRMLVFALVQVIEIVGETIPGPPGAGGDPQVPFGGERVIHKYEMIIYWSDEDGAFVVDVPELPGCMAHGDTRDEALRAADEAVDFWVETAREDGVPVPEPKGRRLMYA